MGPILYTQGKNSKDKLRLKLSANVPSSSLAEIEVEAGVEVEVGVEVG